jgi:hypothetical protein
MLFCFLCEIKTSSVSSISKRTPGVIKRRSNLNPTKFRKVPPRTGMTTIISIMVEVK